MATFTKCTTLIITLINSSINNVQEVRIQLCHERGLSPALLPVFRFLGLIGFDTADVVRCTLHQGAHQIVGLFLSLQRKRGCERVKHLTELHTLNLHS